MLLLNVPYEEKMKLRDWEHVGIQTLKDGMFLRRKIIQSFTNGFFRREIFFCFQR